MYTKVAIELNNYLPTLVMEVMAVRLLESEGSIYLCMMALAKTIDSPFFPNLHIEICNLNLESARDLLRRRNRRSNYSLRQ